MAVQKPGIPKGTRDFSPLEMAKRNYIFNTIRSVYALYGFKQIETPAMENLSTLMGKYVIRYNPYGALTVPREDDTENFTNATPMWLVPTPCSMR